MHPEGQYAVRALKAGVSGFLNKENSNEELLVAVHKVLAGRKYISSSVAENWPERYVSQVKNRNTKSCPIAKCKLDEKDPVG